MSNESEIVSELLLIKEAMSVFTHETLGKISASCSELLDGDLPDEARTALADIDKECLTLLRNRILLESLVDYRGGEYARKDGVKNCCFLPDVYANCIKTAGTICAQSGASFDYSDFAPPCKLTVSARKCSLLMLLPLSLAFSHDPGAAIRLDAARRGNKAELVYRISGSLPDIDGLVNECRKTDRSSGIFFEEPLLAYSLSQTASACGAELLIGENSMTLCLPVAETEAEVDSAPEPYIDNRFSLPYIMLSGIVRREI